MPKLATAFRAIDIPIPSAINRAVAIIPTDGELLMQFVRQRDQRAFAQIVERHGRLVWMICRQVLGHHHDVEDAFQATFLILAQRASTIRASESASAWLYKVAMRTALAARRKRSRRREEPLSGDSCADVKTPSVIDDRELLYILVQELRLLPARYQTPLVMRYLEGQTRRAIADETDSTVAQVQGRLVRGRRMLRSRFLRRGVSLSMAAGAVSGTNESANAAITPALVAQTAENCLALKTSGDIGEISPLALVLCNEGVKAMWFAFVGKCTAVVSAMAIVGGIILAAQGEGDRNSAGDSLATQVELHDGPQKAAASAAENGPGIEQAKALVSRFKYKVPIELGQSEFKEGGRIEIEEVWGTRPKIEIGGQYLVKGKYVLPPGQRGKLYFYETATGNWGLPMPDVDLQTSTFDKDTGEFTLLHEMRGPGYFHLYLAAAREVLALFRQRVLRHGRQCFEKRIEFPRIGSEFRVDGREEFCEFAAADSQCQPTGEQRGTSARGN